MVKKLRHWLHELADRVEKRAASKGKRDIVVNGGLSVSGLQHIGRLRGEVLIGDGVAIILRKRGYRTLQYLVLYTQDAWKGTKEQKKRFGEEGGKHKGKPLISVPDPYGCHGNWVAHYWEDFGGVLDQFTAGKVNVITTTNLYRSNLKPVVKEALEKRELIREIINKYRGRKPHPPSWYPFEPICGKCGRIDSTVVRRVMGDKVEYYCKNCGYEGVASIEEGKLNWRVEWAGIWKALSVDFEPYGKDHATPGGSRDSCKEIAVKVFGIEPPEGVAYEWVSLRVKGQEADMSSSSFKGITPKEWLAVAEAEVLRYLYYLTPPKRKVVIDFVEIPSYYNMYYDGERTYYKKKNGETLTEEEEYKAVTYELSLLSEPPEKMPIQVPYLTLALLVQSIPIQRNDRAKIALERLRASGIIDRVPDSEDERRISRLLDRAYVWVKKYAPESLRYDVLPELTASIKKTLSFKQQLVELGFRLSRLDEWNEDAIKKAMIEHTKDMSSRERRLFYKEFYRVIIGRDSGPRAAPLAAVLGKEFIVKRLTRELD